MLFYSKMNAYQDTVGKSYENLCVNFTNNQFIIQIIFEKLNVEIIVVTKSLFFGLTLTNVDFRKL